MPPKPTARSEGGTAAPKSHTSILAGAVARPAEPARLDEVDLAILRELAQDSRQSQRAIARTVGMSAPAVAERIARLERSGVIKHYGVEIDWDRLGLDVVVFIPVVLESGAEFGPTLEAFQQIEELEELTVVAGRYDLLARFRLSDQRRLRELLLDRVWQIPGVARIETMLGLGNLITESYTSRALGSSEVTAASGEDEAAPAGAAVASDEPDAGS